VSDTSSQADATAVTIAPNGTSSYDFKPGEYQVTSDDGTASVTVTVVAGQTVTVRSISVASTGALMVTAMKCPAGYSPASVDSLPSTCTSSWGNQTFALTPGNSVTTSGAGSAVLSDVAPGMYQLAGAGVCAVVEDGADVSDGFEIAAGLTTSLVVYGCPPDDGTGDGGSGAQPTPGDGTGNPDTGSDGSGGDGTGIGGDTSQSFASNSVLNVSQLPNTGGGKSNELPWLVLVLLAGAFVAGSAGIGLRRAGR
jgi:LPXTG-motif cell wall-anchored protein